MTIAGQGNLEVGFVSQFLETLKTAYEQLWVLDRAVHQLAESSGYSQDEEPFLLRFWKKMPPTPSIALDAGSLWTKESGVAQISEEDVLVLVSVELSSPGQWNVVGALNPLEIIRAFLNYRATIGLKIEEMKLKNLGRYFVLAKEYIDIMGKYGADEEEIRHIIHRLLWQRLLSLGQYQERGIINTADIREIPILGCELGDSSTKVLGDSDGSEQPNLNSPTE